MRLLVMVWIGACAISVNAQSASETLSDSVNQVHWFDDKFSIRIGAGMATYPLDPSDEIQPKPAPVFLAGIDYAVFQNRAALWIRYHNVFVDERPYGISVLQHLVSSGMRWYVFPQLNPLQIDVHAGFLYNWPVFSWDVGGTVGWRFSKSVVAEATMRCMFTFPLFLPAYRWPLVYSGGIGISL